MKFSALRIHPEWKPRCDSWLNQFSGADRRTAELLLDSITYITHEEVFSALHTAVEELIAKLEGSCALYPVTNTKKFKPFEDYEQLPFGLDGDLGSEGDIGHLCRDVSKENHANVVLPFPSLDLLRQERIDHIILLNDTTSSGTQGDEFLNWIWRCKTIRSWHSGRFIQFHYLTYLNTLTGMNLIAQHASRPGTKGLQTCVSGHPSWTPDQVMEVEDVCRKYGAKRLPLGFKDMMSLQVFSYSCPNNVPAVLRYGCQKKGFRGLFERRPTKVSAHSIIGSNENVSALADWLGIQTDSLSHLVCFVLRSRPETPEMLSARLGLPLVSINQALNEAAAAGFVKIMKNAYRVTPEGVRLARGLLRQNHQNIKVSEHAGGRFDYLPLSRGPAASSSNPSSTPEATDG